MCGKDFPAKEPSQRRPGSPPHVRERQVKQIYTMMNDRITPACAGKTAESKEGTEIGRDHPRMCGKDIIMTIDMVLVLGSPPHVRERPCRIGSLESSYGITPACAGKTDTCVYVSVGERDHPRMCGKDPLGLPALFLIIGSPPHVRERLNIKRNAQSSCGITPACAGKTGFSAKISALLWDHPRMCGKDLIVRIA